MNVKILNVLLWSGSVTVLALTSGCCSLACVGGWNVSTSNKFNPTAIYKKDQGGDVVLEGTYTNKLYYNDYERKKFHGYVTISQRKLAAMHGGTNGSVSLADLGALPLSSTQHLKAQNWLPSHYGKTEDFPPNDVELEINVQHPSRGLVILLPLAVPVDIATSPIQLLFFWSWSHGIGP